MSVVVIDTNVPLVANGEAPAAGPDCREACLRAILEVTEGRKRLAIDDARRIISEYGHKLDANGAPKVGNGFYRWVVTNQTNPACCDQVTLHPREDDERDFEEFPRTAGLERFDPADRKFVAVAAAHPDRPPIQQAVDTKWWGWNPALEAAGIRVDFLCPREVGALAEQPARAQPRGLRRRRRG